MRHVVAVETYGSFRSFTASTATRSSHYSIPTCGGKLWLRNQAPVLFTTIPSSSGYEPPQVSKSSKPMPSPFVDTPASNKVFLASRPESVHSKHPTFDRSPHERNHLHLSNKLSLTIEQNKGLRNLGHPFSSDTVMDTPFLLRTKRARSRLFHCRILDW